MRMFSRLTCCAVGTALIAGSGYAYGKKKLAEGPPPTVVIESKKKKKKDEEPPTQILPLPKDPPAAITADSDRLAFDVTPLSAKGLLSQQTRDALRYALSGTKGTTIVRLRAFVAGSGDLRRVQTLVSEGFAEKKLPLPVVSVVQVGAFPLEGAQVQIELTSVDKRVHNEFGLALIGGQLTHTADALQPIEKAIAQAQTPASNVRRVTCYISSIELAGRVQADLRQHFPQAESTVMQMQRAPIPDAAACEAIAALSKAPAKPVELVNGTALLAPGKLAFSGVQLAFKNDQNDVRIAYSRTEKGLEAVGATLKRAVMIHFYPLTRGISETARVVETEFCNKEALPASTLVILEGLPAQDALLGLDVISVL